MSHCVDGNIFQKIFTKEPSKSSNVPICGKDELFYNVENPKRGTALIFNHQQFDDPSLQPREGTVYDRAALKHTFNSLNFDVRCYDDLKFGDIMDIIQKVAKEDHSDADCFVLCVTSHGEQGVINARDHMYPSDKLWRQFTGDNCPTLAGKPKLFFIQACRGNEVDKGAIVKSYRTQTDSAASSNMYEIPAMADLLVMYSTYEGYYSWRSPDQGSWFIQALCEKLDECSGEWDLMSILTFVNRKVAIDCSSNVPGNLSLHKKKQVCTIVSTLTRLFRFSPKNNNDNQCNVF